MSSISRRHFIAATSSAALLSACSTGAGSGQAAKIDAQVDATRDYLRATYPDIRRLEEQAAGVLYMPVVTEAGFIYGGSYGQGALRIGGATVDYYSVTRASVGLQVGAQQYAHVLFFMTTEALSNFRRAPGWTAGADLRYATPEQGGAVAADTTEINEVVAFIYGQKGIIIGASLAGGKYSRIVP